ncbi:MAG: hypothetical protein AABZ02_00055 [Bacteroidota bacterium]
MESFHLLDLASGAKVSEVIRQFNGLQPSFELRPYKFPQEVSLADPLDPDAFFGIVQEYKSDPSVRLIALTASPLTNNYFSLVNSRHDVAIISTSQSELYTPQFCIEDFLHEEILSCILLMLARMNIGHYDTRGCLLDFCEDKRDIVIKLYTGSICADCKARLLYYGVGDAYLAGAQKILWRISKDFHSGKVSRGCPLGHPVCQEYANIQLEFRERNIFFATSFRDEFLDVADHLRIKLREVGYTLKVVNEEISNKSILCKICKTIQTCKYGVAEFSGLRHNVSYEFGLMQAFGLESIAVMKRDRLGDFEKEVSDMKGIEVIPYATIAGDLFDKIHGFVAGRAETREG